MIPFIVKSTVIERIKSAAYFPSRYPDIRVVMANDSADAELKYKKYFKEKTTNRILFSPTEIEVQEPIM